MLHRSFSNVGQTRGGSLAGDGLQVSPQRSASSVHFIIRDNNNNNSVAAPDGRGGDALYTPSTIVAPSTAAGGIHTARQSAVAEVASSPGALNQPTSAPPPTPPGTMAPPPPDFCPFLPRALQPPEHLKYVSIQNHHHRNNSSSNNMPSPPRKQPPSPLSARRSNVGEVDAPTTVAPCESRHCCTTVAPLLPSPLRSKSVIDACGGKAAFMHRMFSMYHPAAASVAHPPTVRNDGPD